MLAKPLQLWQGCFQVHIGLETTNRAQGQAWMLRIYLSGMQIHNQRLLLLNKLLEKLKFKSVLPAKKIKAKKRMDKYSS